MYRNLNVVRGGFRPLQTPFVGELGSAVPSTGEGGRPGWLYTTVEASGWGSNRVALWVTSVSRAGLFVEDNTAWTWSGLVDGTHTAVAEVDLDGVTQAGTTTLTITTTGAADVSGAATIEPVTATGAMSSAGSSGMTGSATLEEVTASGTLASLPASTLNGAANLDPVTASGELAQSLSDVPVADYLERISPSVDVTSGGWAAVGSGSLASAIGEFEPDQADYMQRSTSAAGEAVIALAELLPVGDHVVSMMASVSSGVGRVRLRLLDEAESEVGDSGWQAVFGANVIYKLRVAARRQALYVAIDGGRLYSPDQRTNPSDVRVHWVQVQALAPYDGQNVPDA